MTWFFVDDAMGDHPKVLAIPRAQRLRVLGIWLQCGIWCAKHLTDGQVPPGLPGEYGAEPSDVELLVACRVRPGGAGLWEEDPETGGWVFHDWTFWQRSREEIEARRAVRAEAGRRGGIASGVTRRARSKPEANASTGSEATAKQVLHESFRSNEANTNPGPARRGPGPSGAQARARKGPRDAREAPDAPAADPLATPAAEPLRSAPPSAARAGSAHDRGDVARQGADGIDVRLTGEIVTALGGLMPEPTWEQLDLAAIDGLSDQLVEQGWTRTSIAAALQQRRDTLAAARTPGLAMSILRGLTRTPAPRTSPGCPHACVQGLLEDDHSRPTPCPHCRPDSARRVAQQRAQSYDYGPRAPDTREAS